MSEYIQLYKDAQATQPVYPYTEIEAVQGLRDKIEILNNSLYYKDVGITVPNEDGITAILSGTELSYISKASSGYAYFKDIPIGEYTLKLIGENSQYAEKQISIKPDYEDILTFFSATITVAYPEGSTCTCSDGSTTLTAPDTSGSYTFQVPNAGEWTVNCTDGTDTDSMTVAIITDGQSESVTLNYIMYLLNYADTCDDLTGGWIEKTTNPNKKVAKIDDNGITVSTTYPGSGTWNSKVGFITNYAIDFSNVRTLRAIGNVTNLNSSNSSTSTSCRIEIFDADGEKVSQSSIKVVGEFDITIDCSALNGLYYVQACAEVYTETYETATASGIFKQIMIK